MLSKVLIASTLMLFSANIMAAIWSWIDSVVDTSGPIYNNYAYTYRIDAWDDDDDTPNPCYGLNACTLFISHRHNEDGTSSYSVKNYYGTGGTGYYAFLLTAKTIGELGTLMKPTLNLPITGTINHSSDKTIPDECVGIFYAAGSNFGTGTSSSDNQFNGHPLLPSSVCGVAPTPSSTCNFDNDVINLDHGVLPSAEVNGHAVSEAINITCSKVAEMKLYMYPDSKIQLSDNGDFYSDLYVDDALIPSTGVSYDVDYTRTLNIKSVLRSSGILQPGTFSGSAIIVMELN
ncbi:TPA: hypothetical protein PJH99_002932 [Raoultella ornithinolytica]|jgi:hypothetical protein|uniref:MrpH family fimbial adhesin n=1 Tax=Raoultella ornithinolytica TaxID=54291 RepID=UPI00084A1CC7|nr:hypothetical protein [Raoultella ornithinolytica]AOO58994.1 hypothetical protein AN237_21625 [Raoultella ornithinolytica]EKW7683288.1 hypothetical protein [Raoultella ornithinolytica]ELN4413071.1 hypothetical protein [Raoultella ornithinolytica]MEB6463954.1 hypothetical protein [Raoultella ornithinolytica]MEB8018349.1 hypothetical protein [Raoultella ornithinolytica]